MAYGSGPQLPPSYKRIKEQARAEEALRKDRLKTGMGGGSIFTELWMIVTLPWRVVKWVGRKVAREERADRP